MTPFLKSFFASLMMINGIIQINQFALFNSEYWFTPEWQFLFWAIFIVFNGTMLPLITFTTYNLKIFTK